VLAALLCLAACRAPPVERPLPQAAPTELGPAPCVHFDDLRRYLPKELTGFRKVRDEGSTGKYGEVSISEAERLFRGEQEKELSVRIVDTTMGAELGRAIRATAREADRSGDRGGPRALRIEEAVGFVRFDPDEAKAEASLWVAERFVVAVSGRGFEDTVEVSQVARGLDLTGLASLR
jgi:hypothetical protein